MSRPANESILQKNSVFVWIALATATILLIPLVAMQFTSEVNWGGTDFLVMGVLLYGTGSLFVLVARIAAPKYRLLIAGLFIAAFLYVWAELAVGIFTNWGS